MIRSALIKLASFAYNCSKKESERRAPSWKPQRDKADECSCCQQHLAGSSGQVAAAASWR